MSSVFISSCVTIVQSPENTGTNSKQQGGAQNQEKKCYHPITSQELQCEYLEGYGYGIESLDKSKCEEGKRIIESGEIEEYHRDNKQIIIQQVKFCYGDNAFDWDYYMLEKDDCAYPKSIIENGLINSYDEETKKIYYNLMEKCVKKFPEINIKKEYKHKTNVIEPKISYDCTRLDVQTASDETVARCNLYNYCDKMIAYDITVRKSATEAISQHLNQPYSTSQLIDVYAWAKNNIDYQNVPLDDFAPYRPSETITLKSGDCKNYAAVITSMILSIGGSARIVVVPSCIHAFAEVYIGKDYSLIEGLAKEIKERHQQDIEINVIKDAQGYWLILDGAGANYAGTTEIKECLNPNAERYYSYSCVSSDGKISKQTYKKEYLSQAVTFLCDNCKSLNDCQPECKYVCIKADWVGEKGSKGYEVSKYLGLKTEVYCTCTCYK